MKIGKELATLLKKTFQVNLYTMKNIKILK